MIKILSSEQQSGQFTDLWKHLLQCTECGDTFSAVTSAPTIEGVTIECIRCKNQEPVDDKTKVTDMTQVFDEHLASSLPQTIIDQLENLPHLRRLGTNNLQRLQAIMDLMRHPNNMLQLWVWTRMAWAFGGCDAHLAANNFEALVRAIDARISSERSSDDAVKGAAQIELLNLLRKVLSNDHSFPQWPEYTAFMGGVSEDDPHA